MGFLERFYPLAAVRLAFKHFGPSSKHTAHHHALPPAADDVRFVPPAPDNLQGQVASLLSLLYQFCYDEHGQHRRPQGSISHGQLSRQAALCLGHLGCVPLCGPSRIPNAGTGVFLSVQPGGNEIAAGRVVALYPGTVYGATDPILLASLRNQYVLRRGDGVFIDGKPRGMSARIYAGLLRRYSPPGLTPWSVGDASWLDLSVRGAAAAAATGNAASGLKNPLSVGQFINNGSLEYPPNVTYVDFNLDLTRVPLHQWQFLPNVYYAPPDPAAYPRVAGPDYDPERRPLFGRGSLPMVLLVTTQSVGHGEELRSTYHTVV